MVNSLPQDIRERLATDGWTVLRERSYRAAQQRQAIAESLLIAAKEDVESTRSWALNCLEEERRLRRRLEFVYGVARAHGATVEELSGEQPE
jgi:hypothetical protein